MNEKQYILTDFDSEVEMLEKINEQQATITKLKGLNDDKGKRIISLIRTNKTLKEENEKLKEERQRLIYHLNKEPKR